MIFNSISIAYSQTNQHHILDLDLCIQLAVVLLFYMVRELLLH